ncbi:MAG: 3-dehydroquinate synthase [Myxococcaceae bacterium]|nr:3-dehydroquinate synthase [Myxococcaceae bacterium]
MSAPGSHCPPNDRWGRFASLAPKGAAWIIDAKVARLHPAVLRSIRAPLQVELVTAGEDLKSTRALERLAPKLLGLPRGGTLVAVGGGTVGDFATVVAHLVKRGVTLVQVPTTLLAAVDSSVGGKGALNVGKVKNALGVFHYAARTLLCPELFETLTPAQHREGIAEALKMAVCLDAAVWKRWSRRAPGTLELVKTARALKARVCAADPYEQTGRRSVLNFGHTFGHVIESLSGFRVHHGEAVALGMLCALDVGRAMERTPWPLAEQVEAVLTARTGASRGRLKAVLERHPAEEVGRLLGADKKSAGGALRMVLLERPGVARLVEVPRWA